VFEPDGAVRCGWFRLFVIVRRGFARVRTIGGVALAIFDLDNTLIDRAAAFRRWAEGFAAGRELGADDVAWLERADGDGFTPRGRLLAAVRERYGVEIPVARFRAEMVQCVEVDPGVPQGLRKMRAEGWKVAVATNGETAQQWAKLRRTGLDGHVDSVAVSEEVGVAKPDRRMFAAAAERCGERLTAAAWMIGDCPTRDVGGARAAGLRTVWLHRGRRWEHGDPGPEVIADGIAGAFEALALAGPGAGRTGGTGRSETRQAGDGCVFEGAATP
jgi:HAD superfamily hydrolase (TIGR01509 family)